MARELVSAVIITQNEAARIGACLDCLDFADEILIVDAGSTDGTLAIAEGRGIRVIHHDWAGFGPQKRFAVEQAAHDWVLCVDADERVTDALRASIEDVLAAPQAMVCRIARRNRFMGRWLRHGEGYPDHVIRLFHRGHAEWSDDPVHETVLTDDPVITLVGDLLHESETGVCDYAAKQVRYARLQGDRLRAAGARSSWPRALLSPITRFIKFYLIRLGFLDGLPGLAHILLGCFASFLKHLDLLAGRRRTGSADKG
ncbi:benzoate transporter [Acidihalobacter yilgarnensis]|uniref:Benzoate transporter n=1 Tax=Acidihalobacter yilgarnensis TaxID=2819280 RepID=A0A1D8IKQ6_9GAMM|nr:glycosyltransferase family 2 protein [Acidihalobacter yilgarnensis]AOU97050.1 benzoate transporter [Acidihalobacter yilgarnensis]